MSNGRFVQEYQKGAIGGASPLQLVVMMYDGALRFMEQGKHAMKLHDLEKQNYYLLKAQKIVMELTACLDMEQGGEIAQNLLALYGYVVNELMDANIKDRSEGIDRSIRVISDLRESWVQLESAANQPAEELRAAA